MNYTRWPYQRELREGKKERDGTEMGRKKEECSESEYCKDVMRSTKKRERNFLDLFTEWNVLELLSFAFFFSLFLSFVFLSFSLLGRRRKA